MFQFLQWMIRIFFLLKYRKIFGNLSERNHFRFGRIVPREFAHWSFWTKYVNTGRILHEDQTPLVLAFHSKFEQVTPRGIKLPLILCPIWRIIKSRSIVIRPIKLLGPPQRDLTTRGVWNSPLVFRSLLIQPRDTFHVLPLFTVFFFSSSSQLIALFSLSLSFFSSAPSNLTWAIIYVWQREV